MCNVQQDLYFCPSLLLGTLPVRYFLYSNSVSVRHLFSSYSLGYLLDTLPLLRFHFFSLITNCRFIWSLRNYSERNSFLIRLIVQVDFRHSVQLGSIFVSKIFKKKCIETNFLFSVLKITSTWIIIVAVSCVIFNFLHPPREVDYLNYQLEVGINKHPNLLEMVTSNKM